MKSLKVFAMIFLMLIPMALVSQSSETIQVGRSKEDRNNRKALVVGVEKYQSDKIPNLSCVINDAVLIANTLKEIGVFDVSLLTDETAVLPTRENILHELDNIIDDSRHLKSLVLYFAGHGMNVGGENYFIPIDADTRDKDQLNKTCITFHEIYLKLSDISERTKVTVFFDACRNNPYKKGRDIVEVAEYSTEEGLAPEGSQGIKVFFSTSKGHFAYEDIGTGHGVFSYNLAQSMFGRADENRDGYVSADELQSTLEERMKEHIKSMRYRGLRLGSQVPRFIDFESDGDFVLTKTAEITRKVPNPPVMRKLVEYEDSINIMWYPSVTADIYHLYRADDPADFSDISKCDYVDFTRRLSQFDDKIEYDKPYYYAVRAGNYLKDENDNYLWSDFSKPLKITLRSRKDKSKTIPDEGLEYIIREKLDKYDGPIYVSEMESIVDLDASKMEIETLEGLDQCKNLEKLDVSNNKIEDVSELKELKKLKEADISGNNIKDTTVVEELSNIGVKVKIGDPVSFTDKRLDKAIREQIGKTDGDIYISNIDGMLELEASKQGIASLEGIELCEALEAVFLDHNDITDISRLDGLINLKTLDLSFNKITDISVLERLYDAGAFQDQTRRDYVDITNNGLEVGDGSPNRDVIDKLLNGGVNLYWEEGNEITTNTEPSLPSELASLSYLDMVSVDGGTYYQKTINWDDEKESFKHTVSDFSIGKYEVTYELWYTVYQWAIDNGYKFANAGREGEDGTDGAKPTSSKHEPVTEVNWRDCIVWCNAYSDMVGKTPCYTYNSSVIKDSRDSNSTSCDNAVCDWSSDGYRLPTEGEWQYAASNKGNTPWDYASGASADYENTSATKKVAWYGDNSGGSTHDVGTKDGNGLGLHDMSGNVYEWCWDWYDDLPASSETDYRGAVDGSDRVLRGGSWYDYAEYLRVGYRYVSIPFSEFISIGFRVACSCSVPSR